ncbi:MAG: 4Fe-4S binding protein [ANME-2 cluster archaeon]|nr:4Fe-4S binding protein [ANME-2 cluster archaeon]
MNSYKRTIHTFINQIINSENGGMDIVRIIIDKDRCNGCGDCVVVCKSRNLEVRDGVCVASRPGECKLCMLCKVTCPVGAIEIEV